MRFPLVLAVLRATLPLLGCGRQAYNYEVINDSPDTLTGVRVADPNFSFPEIEMTPYRAGMIVMNEGRIPAHVEVRWKRGGQAAKSVQVDVGLECPGRPKAELTTVQYWIRPDDSIRTRFQMHDPAHGYIDFVPCEPDTERARRLANDALAQAAESGDVVGIETALKNAQLNPVSYFDPAPLHVATAAGQLAAVRYLLQRGARIEVPQRPFSQSALVVAIERGQLQIAELLIDSGADLNKPGATDTPLQAASEKGYVSLVELLLNRGADIKLQSFGQSALIDAARAGQLAVVELLLKRGADPNTSVGGTSSTALDIAEQYQHADVAALLISAGAKHGPPR
jgi:hypothetical protein